MKWLVVICLTFCVSAAVAGQTIPRSEPAVLPSFLELPVDRDMSMRAVAAWLRTLHHGIAALEDRTVGTRWFDEGRLAGKAGGIALRFGKLALLDLPVDYFTVVLGHEYAGHGARYRELGIGGVHYAFDAPPPYGAGGGEASSDARVNAHEAIAIWSGGVESHPVLQRGLALRWLEKRRVSYREALLYFWAAQIGIRYIKESDEALTTDGPDNDAQAYVRLLNFGLDRPPNPVPQGMTVADLKAKTSLDFLNPFTVYSIYVGLVTYLWRGEQSAPLPMLEIGPVSYLPLLRTGWTPFGVQYHLENYLRFGKRTGLVDLHRGDRSFHDGWGGIGVDVYRVLDTDRLRIDGGVKLWRQPALQRGFDPATTIGGGVGGAVSIKAFRQLGTGGNRSSAFLEVGYKSAGYVAGYQMRAGPIATLGLALRN